MSCGGSAARQTQQRRGHNQGTGHDRRERPPQPPGRDRFGDEPRREGNVVGPPVVLADPRDGPPQRSGVIRVGRAAARELLAAGEVFAVSVNDAGEVLLSSSSRDAPPADDAHGEP